MFIKMCPICGEVFTDGDKVVVVMASTFKKLDSEVHFAITQPTECHEIIHDECYDFPGQEMPDDSGLSTDGGYN